ncbi:SDR family NAD(P)-dependent oxidoreductase [Celeribacter indicus]|uniref:Short-chain dehydrogenase/reductase sDR n=1 Tax=Celeribacter indicus TaxID=1208324 RepID=A0A0B5DX29_9RHOB|nr:SDR family NAD(P)-dependent oxidoreductase [Celeribacter indicus]AJE47579.1 short-chain dehydrogenase/reductase sDR [Celeribacter indicus]SDW10844.1 Tropinone reductase 1 [Celeribacter indicus]
MVSGAAENRTVLITGADRGVGLACREACLARGWTVIATARHPAAIPAGAEALAYDPAREGAAARLAAQIGSTPLDAVIFAEDSTAGNALRPEEIGRDLLIGVMMENTHAPLDLAARLAPNLRRAPRPAIVALSGNAGMTGSSVLPLSLPLKASKAALRQMWRNLAVEWAEWGCRCIVVTSEGGGRIAALLAALEREANAAYEEL